MVSERKTGDGGTVAIYSDITELKQREEQLSEKSPIATPRKSSFQVGSSFLAQ